MISHWWLIVELMLSLHALAFLWLWTRDEQEQAVTDARNEYWEMGRAAGIYEERDRQIHRRKSEVTND